MKLFCGIDWAEAYQHVAIIDGDVAPGRQEAHHRWPGGIHGAGPVLAAAGDDAHVENGIADYRSLSNMVRL
ncbi:hypothetical protein ACAG24_024955 [Mycobacterium sp. pW049]|uniref:hypothetical protein n=1 Tax=[Mycobacterium] bulgaricum TaxID=3238985 RepID=UPI00351B7095